MSHSLVGGHDRAGGQFHSNRLDESKRLYQVYNLRESNYFSACTKRFCSKISYFFENQNLELKKKQFLSSSSSKTEVLSNNNHILGPWPSAR